MILIDSDVFLLDNFYQDDPRQEENSLFLHRVQKTTTYTTIFNLLEVACIVAPYCSEQELIEFFDHFDRTYNIEILQPKTYDLSTTYFLNHLFGDLLQTARHVGGLVNSLVFNVVKENDVRVIVAWNNRVPKENTKAFGKLEYLKPTEYLKFFNKLSK